MYIPKIIFKYAYPFDQDRRMLYQERNWPDYPDSKKVIKRVEEYKSIWADFNKDDKIIKRIIEILGVSYPRDIEAYVFGMGMRPMSTPLLIPLSGKGVIITDEQFIELLIHELIHIFAASTSENPRLSNYWKTIREIYAKEIVLVQNHLIVYAVVEIILTELFDKEKMQELITVDNPDYKRSIKLVEELGSEKLIDEFKKLTAE